MSWNPPADLAYAEKQLLVRDYFDRYKPSVVIETGLYAGQGSSYQFVDEAKVYALDMEYGNVTAARAAGVEAFSGDSGELLPQLLARVDAPALFWLDAHAVVEKIEENSSPLLAELDAILAWPHARASIVLIDDVRMMGLPGWPTVEHVRVKVANAWVRAELDDVMRLTPR